MLLPCWSFVIVPIALTVLAWTALSWTPLSWTPCRAAASELRQTPVVKAVQRARPAVVNIRGEKTVSAPISATGQQELGRRVNGMGTGVVIDQRGYILTNHHVVDGVRDIQVTLADGKQHVAKLVCRDPETDLAIIKIETPEKLPVIDIGTSSDLMPGETVIAVGNAYGYEHTVTQGIISALSRAVQVSDAQFYEDLIQTDASINPGNSGGPLLNIDGQMIGLNVAVRAGAQGIGFAIPVDKATAVASKLLAAHNMGGVWHGMTVKDKSGTPCKGVVIASVDPNSPAAEAGVKPGDLITRIDHLELKRTLDFRRAVLDRKADEKIELTVKRDDEPLTLSMILVDAPDDAKPAVGRAWNLLGMQLAPINPAEFRKRFQTRYRGGLTVQAVRPDSPASGQGIRQGDVLVGMHIWETVSLDNVAYILKRPEFASQEPIKFFILRGDETLYGHLPLTMKPQVAKQ